MDTLTPAPTARGPRTTLWLLRLVITGYAAGVLAQPLLAGLYLSGDVDAIAVHGAVGGTLAAVGLLVVGATLPYVLGGRGRLWVLPVAVVLVVATVVQISAGYERTLELHVPLGVAIVTASVLLVAWVWSPSAARPRGAR